MANTGTHTPHLQKYGGAHASNASCRERDETYWGVIVALSDRYRVIIDEQGNQFILQKHYAESLHGGVWRGQSYSTTRDGLIKACVGRDCLSDASQELLLDALPSTAREYAAQIELPR